MKRFFLWLIFVLVLALPVLYANNWMIPYWFMPRDHDSQNQNSPPYGIIATELDIPWDIAFLPDGDLLVSERQGRLIQIGKHPRILIENAAFHDGEGGLQGIALHPDFKNNSWVYLYSTAKKAGRTINRVERYRFDDENGNLTTKTLIIDDIPGAKYHDGGRIAFGPDGYLYITTGDASQDELAQDIHSLAGKILRLHDDGTIPSDNPFDNAVYSYGHRNAQGLTWDDSQKLWSTEHGPSGFESGEDELNLIEKAGNYGWPIVKGPQSKPGIISPILQSGKEDTWAPASALYWDGSIFFGGLRGEALYEAKVNQRPVILKEHFKKQFGRIRTVILGPDGYFYLTTSNQDGRGFPKEGDDKIIRIDPRIFRE